MNMRPLITSMSRIAGLGMAIFLGAGASEARADDSCFGGGCDGETCASTKSCNAAAEPGIHYTTCGAWMQQQGVTCGPTVSSAIYGNNNQCTTSPNRNSSSPLVHQDDEINSVSLAYEWDGIKLRYTIPWPSASQDPCWGIGKEMHISYTCGMQSRTAWVSAEAANKTVVLSCPW